jgi:hypothetical protein
MLLMAESMTPTKASTCARCGAETRGACTRCGYAPETNLTATAERRKVLRRLPRKAERRKLSGTRS